jgi:putative tricarboxylic transport membrane protein
MKSADSMARQRRALVIVGVSLCALAALTWMDAIRVGGSAGVGIGPSVSMKLIGGFMGLLGLVHLFTAFTGKVTTIPEEDMEAVNHQALGWVIGGLLAMIGVLTLEGGFIIGATIVFVATARAFGRKLLSMSPVIGLVLSTLVYVFFSKVLSLSLPVGPLERLFFS